MTTKFIHIINETEDVIPNFMNEYDCVVGGLDRNKLTVVINPEVMSCPHTERQNLLDSLEECDNILDIEYPWYLDTNPDIYFDDKFGKVTDKLLKFSLNKNPALKLDKKPMVSDPLANYKMGKLLDSITEEYAAW